MTTIVRKINGFTDDFDFMVRQASNNCAEQAMREHMSM
jgi:hypothetical protein